MTKLAYFFISIQLNARDFFKPKALDDKTGHFF